MIYESTKISIGTKDVLYQYETYDQAPGDKVLNSSKSRVSPSSQLMKISLQPNLTATVSALSAQGSW